MQSLIAMGATWGLVTIVFFALLIYRRSLTKQEADWIPLTNDAKEDSAIKAQTLIDRKARKLTVPIRALGAVWVVLLLVVLGFWIFHNLSTPPPMPQ